MTDAEKFRLSLLLPDFRARVEGIVQRMVARGYGEPYIGSTLRTPTEQDDAIKRGTTGRRQKLTWHFKFTNPTTKAAGARAVDFRFRLPGDKPDPTTERETFFMSLWEEATAVGCRSLAYDRDTHGRLIKKLINGGKLWDAGHVEYRYPFKTLVEACRAEAPHLLGEDPPNDPDDVIPEPLALGELPPSPFRDA